MCELVWSAHGDVTPPHGTTWHCAYHLYYTRYVVSTEHKLREKSVEYRNYKKYAGLVPAYYAAAVSLELLSRNII